MKNNKKTKNELIAELKSVYRKIKRLEAQLQKSTQTKQDIMERKRAEEALQKNEQQFRSFVEQAPLAIIVTRAGTTLYTNDKAVKMFGLQSGEEFNRRPIVELFAPQYREESKERTRRRALGLPLPSEYESVGLRANGSQFPIHLSVSQIQLADGKANIAFIADITEHKRTEEALLESEERFHRLSDATFEAVAIHKSGVLLSANAQYFEMFGYTPDELLGKQALPLTVAPEAIEYLMKQMESGNLGPYESIGLRKNGTRFPMEIRVREAEHEGQRIRIGTIRDITERKRVEEALRESETRYRAVVEDQTEVISRFKPDGTLTFVNEVFCRFVGKPAEELIGHKWQPLTVTEDLPKIEAKLHALSPDHPVETIESRVYNESGDVRWMQFIKRAFLDSEGRIIETQSVGRDITERKLVEEAMRVSEEKFYKAFHSSPNLMAITTLREGRIIEINDAYCRALGYECEECLNHTTPELHIWADLGQRSQFVQKIKDEGHAYNIEVNLRKKSHEIISVALSMEPITINNQECLLSVAMNITERKRMEEELIKSHDEFRMLVNHLQTIREEERNRLAREFHDQLGQSMTALKMDLSLLLRTISDEKQDVQRNLVAAELQSMQNLVDEAINLIWVIITELRPQMLDDLGLVAALEWEAQQFKSRTGITCEFKSSAGDIQIDSKKSIALFRIYQEALTNVARHANATVVKSVLQRDGEMLVLEIKDNGCGISIDEQFKQKPFGLIGMRERALAIDGLLEINGIAGEGTTIIVRLPIGQVVTEESKGHRKK